MPKLRLIGLTLLALSATAVSHAEEKRYVSDELNTRVRSGPGDNYRPWVRLTPARKSRYYRPMPILITPSERQHRTYRPIPLKELNSTPSLRTRVPTRKPVKILTDKLNNIDTTWNQRTADMQQKVAQSDSVIDGLKQENQKLKKRTYRGAKRR